MDRQRPNWNVLESMLDDVRRSLDGLQDTQQRLMRLTATAYSEDRLVKAVVGPRGQLVDLEIDPRVYRAPNSKALAASIVATVRAAVDQVLQETAEILDDNAPRDTALRIESPAVRMARQHDADVLKEMAEADE